MLKMVVVTLPRVESRSNSLRSPVVHGYKSHHQLSEHPQPPLLHQIDGEMEEKSMASSRQKEPALSCLGVWCYPLLLSLRYGKLKAEFEQADRREQLDWRTAGLESLKSI